MSTSETIKPILTLPNKPGSYNVMVSGVSTFMPLYLEFDGEKWLELDYILKMADGDINKISYFA